MSLRHSVKTVLQGAGCLALAGCVMTGPGSLPTPPDPIPQVTPAEPTPKSAAASAYYAQVQQLLLSQGMLRSDGGAEVPVSARALADNFMRIALFDEYRRGSGGFVRQETESRLRRWEVPIRFSVRFGPSVPPEKQATDRARIASYVARLSQITGRSMSLDERSPNFFVYIVSEDERETMGPLIEAALPGLSPSDVAGITAMPRSTYCLVYALAEGNTGSYTRAFAVIRAEHPDLLRLSCVHEELTQGLGLPNDSPRARPSIFNDDEEFALLTDQDEKLLRILYSPELQPGMSAADARPIVEMLARRLTGGES
jgi:Protein of unknown function (DUF2927)